MGCRDHRLSIFDARRMIFNPSILFVGVHAACIFGVSALGNRQSTKVTLALPNLSVCTREHGKYSLATRIPLTLLEGRGRRICLSEMLGMKICIL